MSYGDYVEQLTYLLFLKMADERSRPPYSQKSLIPEAYAWPGLLEKNPQDTKSGAGQYFTPRALIRASASTWCRRIRRSARRAAR